MGLWEELSAESSNPQENLAHELKLGFLLTVEKSHGICQENMCHFF